MQPLIYSAQAALDGVGWRRGGREVTYFENGVTRRDREKGSHSTMSFVWTCEHDSDLLYFAMCYPYTYTDLRSYLSRVQADPLRARHVRRQRLSLTIAGNECEMLLSLIHI